MTLDIVAHPATAGIKNNITVIKTLGNQEPFDREKLLSAVKKATGYTEGRVRIAEDIYEFVMKKLSAPTVATGYINALVEGYLLAKYEKTKNSEYKIILDKYIQNKRRKQDELMQKVSHMKDVILGAGSIKDLRKFSFNQTQIAAARYLLRDIETGEVIETIPEWFHRIASHVVLGSIMYDDEIYEKDGNYIRKTKFVEDIDYKPKNLGEFQVKIIVEKFNELVSHMKNNFDRTLKIIDTKLVEKYNYLYKQYYDFMHEGIFEPNTPTLLNMGTPSGAGSACFTIAVEDNMESIMKAAHDAAFIFKTAGGFGTNVSYIRPKGSPVGNTFNAATGGIALVLEQIDHLTNLVKAGGKRRGANMGIMEYWHPQILEFIDYKLTPGKLENFNISVMFDDNFWQCYNNDKDFDLVFNNKKYDRIDPHDLIRKIADNAWKSAEPGVLFADNANKKNPLRDLWGDIKVTNPCVSSRTRLHTNKGMKTVEELYRNNTEIEVAVDTVVHRSFKRYSKANETQMMQMKASKVFKTADDADLLKIETEDGYELECTPYHPMVLADGSMKDASDLKDGDELLLQSSKGLFGVEGNSDIGALLGFAQNHMQLIAPEDKFIDDIFQKYTMLNKFDNIYHRLNSQYISNMYGEPMPLNAALDFCKFKVNVVPDVVWNGKEQCVKSYLKLLFSTSAVCVVERELIRYYNNNRRFLQDLQILLINFGIKSTIRGDDPYYITVSGKSFKPFMYKVGLTTSFKIRNIDVPKNSTGEVKYFTKVINVTKLPGKHMVYDAEEYETHKLIFNGIVTGNCVISETLLATSNGMERVGDLYKSGKPLTIPTDNRTENYDPNNMGITLRPAVPIFKTSDEADVWEIETKHGYSVTATNYHKFYIQEEKNRYKKYIKLKELKDLKVGDKLLIQSDEGYFGKQGSRELGAVIGWYQADGYDTKAMDWRKENEKRKVILDFYHEKKELTNQFLSFVNSILPKTKSNIQDISITNLNGRNQQTIQSTRLGDLFILNNITKYLVPDVIWQGTKECVVSYLQSLFSADGTINISNSTCSVRLSSINKEFLKQVQMVLGNLGIQCSITKRRDECERSMPDGKGGMKSYKCQSYYEIIISGNNIVVFSKQVGFLLKHKQEKLDGFINSRMKPILSKSPYTSKIKSITYKGKQAVYDTTEYKTHTILINNVVSSQCSEQFMYHGESCTLGSINLSRFVDNFRHKFNYNKFKETVLQSTQFLNDVLEINQYPTEDIKKNSNITKRIGLGIMGLADALFKMKIPYNSEEGYKFMNDMACDLYYDSVTQSIELAKQRGPCDAYSMLIQSGKKPIDIVDRVYPELDKDLWIMKELEKHGVRNMWTTTIAPTGTISMIADCSNGLEPIFALVYKKTVQTGDHYYLNKEFENALVAEGLYSDEIIKKVEQNYGSVQGLEEIPEWMQKVFVTAMDLHWTDHVVAQAVWQQWIDNSISKCIAKGTLVQTNKGVMRIEDIGYAGGNDVFADVYDSELKVRDLDGNWKKVTKHYSGGKKQTVKIRLNNGNELEGTMIHKVMTDYGWKTLGQLEEGDLVAVRKVDYNEDKEGGMKLPSRSRFVNETYQTRYNNTNSLTHMTPQLAKILGMIVADGSINESSGHIGIVTNNEIVKKTFIDLIKQTFNVKTRIIKDKRRVGLESLSITSGPLAKQYREMIGHNAFNKHIPIQILQGSKAEQKAFLEGLTLDGYIKKNKYQTQLVVYEGVSKQLRDEVASILYLNGMTCYKGQKLINYNRQKQQYYTYNVIVNSNWIEPIEPHKQVTLKESMMMVSCKGVSSTDKYLKHVVKYNNNVSRLLLQKHGIEFDSVYFYKVTSKEYSESEVYDIEVEDTHSYLINGIISHNTINMPNNVTPDDIEYAYVLAHELGLKGVSVYRDGSRHLQVLHTDTSVKTKEGEIGAKSSKEITLIKKQLAPSAATIDYIMKNVKNKDILDKFMKYIDNDKQQVYIQANEKCEKCNEGVYVDQGGCRSCNICGYSISCSVG